MNNLKNGLIVFLPLCVYLHCKRKPLEQKKVLKDDISGKTVLSVSKTVSRHWDQENINVYENEKKWLKKLKDADIIAKPISFNDQTRTITTEYAGEKITKKTLPENWKEQFDYIVSTLQKNNCRHNDIKPDELLVYNNKIKVVDFGWAYEIDKEIPNNWPTCLGGEFKCSDKFDDECSLKKCINKILKRAK